MHPKNGTYKAVGPLSMSVYCAVAQCSLNSVPLPENCGSTVSGEAENGGAEEARACDVGRGGSSGLLERVSTDEVDMFYSR
jgi:hypothetical protein